MKRKIYSFLRRLREDRSGSVIIMATLQVVVILGFASLAIDLASVYNAQRLLQASTDAAANAGALAITGTNTAANVKAQATLYSAVKGDKNADPSLLTGASATVTLKCLTYLSGLGVNCAGTELANAVQVQQTATVPLSLAQAFGLPSVNISASAIAGSKGGYFPPLNVMVIIDTTGSMGNSDSNCPVMSGMSKTRLHCAMTGVQTLLQQLWPSVDQVGLMVFPGLTSATVPYDYCSPNNKSVQTVAYNASPAPVYQIIGLSANPVPFSSSYQSEDYKTSNTTQTLNPTSDLALAAGAEASCAGLQNPGGFGTYYADVITAAQAALAANGKPNVQNAIIFVSDGDASANITASGSTSAKTAKGSTILNFSPLPTGIKIGMAITDSKTSGAIPSGTTVVSTTATTVTMSNAATGNNGVGSGDNITFTMQQLCHKGVAAAQAAAAAGTWIYSVAYGAATSGGCSNDTSPTMTPCQAMQQIASDPTKFYSDQSGGSNTCTSAANPTADLVNLFKAIGNTFSATRMFSMNTK